MTLGLVMELLTSTSGAFTEHLSTLGVMNRGLRNNTQPDSIDVTFPDFLLLDFSLFLGREARICLWTFGGQS